MLEPIHTKDLALIENLMHWDRMSIEMTNEEMIRRGENARDEIENECIKEIVSWRLEMRTVVKAMRRRALGRNAPLAGSKWGFGRWLRIIEKHWNEPSFGLDQHFSWIFEAGELLEQKNHLALERLLLDQLWHYYGRVAEEHYFDFEAIVVYVLRWDVINRWSRYDGQKAEQRFGKMLDSTLGEYVHMYA